MPSKKPNLGPEIDITDISVKQIHRLIKSKRKEAQKHQQKGLNYELAAGVGNYRENTSLARDANRLARGARNEAGALNEVVGQVRVWRTRASKLRADLKAGGKKAEKLKNISAERKRQRNPKKFKPAKELGIGPKTEVDGVPLKELRRLQKHQANQSRGNQSHADWLDAKIAKAKESQSFKEQNPRTLQDVRKYEAIKRSVVHTEKLAHDEAANLENVIVWRAKGAKLRKTLRKDGGKAKKLKKISAERKAKRRQHKK